MVYIRRIKSCVPSGPRECSTRMELLIRKTTDGGHYEFAAAPSFTANGGLSGRMHETQEKLAYVHGGARIRVR